MGLILYIITWILEPFLNIFNFITVIIVNAKKRGFWKVVNEYFYQASVSKDRFGNYNYRTLFNLIFIKKDSKFNFGDAKETISSVLGKNQLAESLTIVGWIVVILLWVFVPFKHIDIGHCVYYIE